MFRTSASSASSSSSSSFSEACSSLQLVLFAGLLSVSLLLVQSSSATAAAAAAAAIISPITISSAAYPTSHRYFFNDEFNRTRLFRGVNVVYKDPPYLPKMDRFNANLSFVQDDVLYLKSMGVNLIRLSLMWPGKIDRWIDR